MTTHCLTAEEPCTRPTDQIIRDHLQQVVYDIQECAEDSHFLAQQLHQMIRLAEINGWNDTRYFLEMAKGTLAVD